MHVFICISSPKIEKCGILEVRHWFRLQLVFRFDESPGSAAARNDNSAFTIGRKNVPLVTRNSTPSYLETYLPVGNVKL